MPVTYHRRMTGASSFLIEEVERTPDRYALAWPGLVSFGALYAVDANDLYADPDHLVLAMASNLVSTGEECIERAAVWFCDRADRWWLRAYFALEHAYWWTLREVLWRRLGVIETNGLEVFSWRRHVYPLNPLRRLLARHGGR